MDGRVREKVKRVLVESKPVIILIRVIGEKGEWLQLVAGRIQEKSDLPFFYLNLFSSGAKRPVKMDIYLDFKT